MNFNTVIAIGRQYGSGGREIGELLSDMMGIPFFDRELVAIAAEKSGVSKDVYSHIDETATNSLLYALSTGAYTLSSHFTTVNDLPLNDKLYIIQTNLIKDIVKENRGQVCGLYFERRPALRKRVYPRAAESPRTAHNGKRGLIRRSRRVKDNKDG